MLIATTLFTVTSLLLIGLAIPLIRRKVKPNPLYGLRVASTFADEWVWYEANASTGRDLVILAIFQLLLVYLLPNIPGIQESSYVLVNAVALAGGALLTGIVGWVRANRLLEQRREQSR